jgi:hypothetical protein
MKLNKFFVSGVSFAVMISMVLPGFVLAKENESSNSGASKSRGLKFGVNFCNNLLTIETKLEGWAAEREARLSKNRIEREKNQKKNLEEKNIRAQKNKNKDEENKEGRYKDTFGKAKTDQQKAAVKIYADTIMQAAVVRKAAIDAAMTTFKNGISAIVASRKAEVDAVLNALKAAISAAVDKAKADCEAGLGPQSARAVLQASIKAAGEQYKDKIKQIEKRGDGFQALLDAKNKAIKDANDAFKTAVQNAKDTLRAALGK